MNLHEDFYDFDKRNGAEDHYGEGVDPRDDDWDYDDYGCDDGCGYDDDIGGEDRGLWEYEAEFDRAAREIERSHRSPAAKILVGLIVIAAALAIYLGVSEYMSTDHGEDNQARVSFVWAGQGDTACRIR